MTKRDVAIAALVLLPIGLLASWWVRIACMFVDLPPHVGDGEFQNISKRHGPFVLNGYRVVFEKFDLSKDYENKVSLSRLPEFGFTECRLFFVIDDPEDRITGRHSVSIGRVALELCDSRGNMIAHVKDHLNKLGWSGTLHRHALYPTSIPTPSHFDPDPDETYTLTISYNGDPHLASLKGHASIECGGRK